MELREEFLSYFFYSMKRSTDPIGEKMQRGSFWT